MTDELIQAYVDDVQDCNKMFVCELNTKDDAKLGNVELQMKNAFGLDANNNLDLTKETVGYDLAASVGKVAGLDRCKIFYGRCNVSYNEMKDFLELQQS